MHTFVPRCLSPLSQLSAWSLGVAVVIAGLSTCLPPGHAQVERTSHTKLHGVRISHSSSDARLTLEFDNDPAYRFFNLSDPYRVVIDIRSLDWNNQNNPLPAHHGLISNLRYGLYQADVTRIVLDLDQPARIDKYSELPGSAANNSGRRLYIDLSASGTFSPQRFTSTNWPVRTITKPKPPDPARSPGFTARRHSTKKRVVLDPGHGGVDPGSVANKTIYEKNIVLRFARVSQKLLEGSGRYVVSLTRNSDLYIPLRDRYKFAEQQEADVFISIHADKLLDQSIRGSSVYTLSDRASDAESASLATQVNRSDILTGHALASYSPDVSSILIDLAQESTNRHAWRLAEALLKAYPKSINTVGKPHRYAGFAVLKSPNVPSILVELGFMSNPEDTKLLAGNRYPKQFASSLLKALDAYFSHNK